MAGRIREADTPWGGEHHHVGLTDDGIAALCLSTRITTKWRRYNVHKVLRYVQQHMVVMLFDTDLFSYVILYVQVERPSPHHPLNSLELEVEGEVKSFSETLSSRFLWTNVGGLNRAYTLR